MVLKKGLNNYFLFMKHFSYHVYHLTKEHKVTVLQGKIILKSYLHIHSHVQPKKKKIEILGNPYLLYRNKNC